MTCEYEKLRLKNLEDNKRVLAELGLMNPFAPKRVQLQKKAVKRKAPAKEVPKPKPAVLVAAEEAYASDEGTPHKRRRSNRLKGQTPDQQTGEEVDEPDEDETPRLKAPPNRPNFYGAVPDVPIGTVWETRLECCIAGVHRPTVAGIHAGPEGAYSIALSGGYDDNVDLGECFTYTGEGGRDLKGTKANPKNLRTAPQSKDQTLSRGNLALTKNAETGQPVRVIRGYKLPTQYAPDEGYRYDGLYKVEKHWYTTGVSGFGVFKFALRRLENQAPPPWTYLEEGSQKGEHQQQQETSTEQAATIPVDAEKEKKPAGTTNSEEAKDKSSLEEAAELAGDKVKPEDTASSQDSGIGSQGLASTDAEVDIKDSTPNHQGEKDLKNDPQGQSTTIKMQEESSSSCIDGGSQEATLDMDEKVLAEDDANVNATDTIPGEGETKEAGVVQEEIEVKCQPGEKCKEENKENLKSKENVVTTNTQEDENCNFPKKEDAKTVAQV